MIKLKENETIQTFNSDVQFWWVNQGTTFELDSKLNRISCREDANGKYHKSLCKTQVGDFILHYSKGKIKAVSIITKDCYFQDSRRINDCKYYLLKHPISKDFIVETVDVLPRPPFNFVNNGIQQSYLFKIDKNFFKSLFSSEIEVKNL